MCKFSESELIMICLNYWKRGRKELINSKKKMKTYIDLDVL